HEALIQGNVRTHRFSTVWEQGYACFRSKDRTSSAECRSCAHWEHCLGGALHTWDFAEQRQRACPHRLLEKARHA
ncbi:MAG: hypothetical protein LBD25_07690, partial [Coriobacteriales bacterium]|nr:hypothetical protein [Coriobacteriales bacterium]